MNKQEFEDGESHHNRRGASRLSPWLLSVEDEHP